MTEKLKHAGFVPTVPLTDTVKLVAATRAVTLHVPTVATVVLQVIAPSFAPRLESGVI